VYFPQVLRDGLAGWLWGIFAVITNDKSIVFTQDETKVGQALMDFGRRKI